MKRRIHEKAFYSYFRVGIALVICLLAVSFVSASDTVYKQKYLMRFPDVCGDSVVFVCGEDIWKASIDGGTAVRLTSHAGEERSPRFSPDGKYIAFTAEYDGNTDVYVMDSDGGNITRLTYFPDSDSVVGWHPLKNKIIFRSNRASSRRYDRLFMVSPDGTGLETLILHEATYGSFSPDGKQIAYTRVGNEERTWKRYRGGRAQDIYVYDFEKKEDRNITNFNGTDNLPIWMGEKIYFTSDRDNVLNIYSYDTKTAKIEQLTHYKDYDVLRPSGKNGKIVYQLAGELYALDVNTGQSRLIKVNVNTDAPETRPYYKKVDEFIAGVNISPNGDRAIVNARGEVFTVPKANGPIRNITQDSGARDKDAVWSPDGTSIAYISDKTGEYEIYIVDPRGKTQAVKLTQHINGYRYALHWSPDSKKLAFADQTHRCFYIDISTKKITEIDHAQFENMDIGLDRKPIYDLAWSPDSRFIAYTKMDADLVNKIYIYSLETNKTTCVSKGLFNDFNPVFSRDGERLFFISNRCISSTFCDFEWEMIYKKIAGIFCLTLKKDAKPFLTLKSDEGESSIPAVPAANKPASRVIIDFDGIAERVEKLPLPNGNYRYLQVNNDSLFYLNADKGDFNQFEFNPAGPFELYSFSFAKQEETKIIKEIDSYQISFDGTSIVYKKENEVGIIPSDAKDSEGNTLDLEDLTMRLDPVQEWKQIYNEAWRMAREFYYEPNMNGLNWEAMKTKYGRLLPYAACRGDVLFLIGELIGELNSSHAYIKGGDTHLTPEKVNVGMLGADYEEDTVNKRFRFKKIYREPDWSRDTFPPLAAPGLNVHEGDYLLAVNGKPIFTGKEIYSYFQGLGEKQVTLLINKTPTEAGAREITVKTLTSDSQLHYLDWMEHNRLTVEKESNGELGYLYLPDTFENSVIDFPKYFYSQLTKKGIIVDARFNGGGLDPDVFLDRLDKKIHSYWTRRYSHDQTTPFVATNAHFACLTNLYAGSGGDHLPWLFRHKKMGPVIGTRTWGGLIGTSMDIELIDGGSMNMPDYRIYDTEGRWLIENVGVEPDITVDLNPDEVARGIDAQLLKGIRVLMEKIKQEPRIWPKHQPFPVDEAVKNK